MATRAHTVPRFYLQGFAAPESEDGPDPFVWLGFIVTGKIERRAPKNISIVRGLYDGVGTFVDNTSSVEDHLSRIESEAAFAIRRFVSTPVGGGASPDPAVWRFLAWQAARTPGWLSLAEEHANDQSALDPSAVEPPPVGFENIRDRARPLSVENPETGERREVHDFAELRAFQQKGWKWRFTTEDKLEALHMQAWYFQVRHFPRLKWSRLECPEGEYFVTSDRAVAWLADGFADTPPAALRHPTAQVVAPLTRETALVGRHSTSALNVIPREVNRFVAFAASEWVAGPTRDAVAQAISDCSHAEAQ